MGTVTRLPTASPCFYTVRKVGKIWAVQIVTPSPMVTLRTTIVRFSEQADAIAYGERAAAAAHRPFKSGRAA